jgi:predicted dehydrogenase
MSSKLRWGILGCGNIARQFATGLVTSQRGTLVAAGSRSLAKAQDFSRAFQARHAHGSYQELIADPDIDVVYNALPNSLHHQWTLAAFASGKHVLCEKPLAMNTAQSQEMFDAAEKSGRVLMEAFMYRSHPLTLAVIESIRSGAIGQLQLIRTSFCFRTSKPQGNIRFEPTLGGGALMDIGCYCINFSRLFAGEEPSEIHTVATMHSSGVDEMASATLRFPSGIIASMTCGMTLQADNAAHLCGSEGYIEIPIPWKPPAHQSKYIISRGIPPRMDSAPSASPAAPSPPPRDIRLIDTGPDLYAIEADDFAATILDHQSPRISRADSLGNMRVLDEMRRQVIAAPSAPASPGEANLMETKSVPDQFPQPSR